MDLQDVYTRKLLSRLSRRSAMVVRNVSGTPPDTTPADIADFVSRAAAQGGTITAGEQAALLPLITDLKANNFWNDADIGLIMGGFSSCLVKLRCHSSSTLLATSTVFNSGNYSFLGLSETFAGSGAKVDVGVNANQFQKNNVTIGTFRVESPAKGFGANAANICGVNGALTDLGFTRQTFNNRGGYVSAFLDSSSSLIEANNSGFLAGSGGSTVAHYRNGYGLSSKAGVTGTFNSNTLYFPNSDAAYYGGWFVLPRALSAAEHLVLAGIWNTFQAAIGRTFQDAFQSTLFVGDSITFGYEPPTSQVSSPYFAQLTARLYLGENRYMLGVIGQAAFEVLANIDQYLMRYYPIVRDNRVLLFIGTNDLGNYGYSAATVLASIIGICTALKAKGFRVYVGTMIPSSSYASFSSLANYNVQAPLLTTAILADARFTNGILADGIARIDNKANLSNPNNTTYFFDGIHPTNAGLTSISDAFYDCITASEPVLNSITIANPSFEADATPLDAGAFGSYSITTPSGYTYAGSGGRGVYAASNLVFISIPNGTKVGYIQSGGSLSQINLATILANTIYDFYVFVCAESNLTASPVAYSINILAGSTVIASTITPSPPAANFIYARATFDTRLNPAYNGQQIGIQLVANSAQVCFDSLGLYYKTF